MVEKFKVVGTRVSTFTRTVRMALSHLKIPYELMERTPHSDGLKPYTPFGKVPILLIPGRVCPLLETLVIRTYLDATNPVPLTPQNNLHEQLEVDFWISVVGDHVFKNVIEGILKPRLALEDQGVAEPLIHERLIPAMDLALKTLESLDHILEKTYIRKYICGEQLTWADLYLYPPMADLFALPEAEAFKHIAPLIWSWYQDFERLELARDTYHGTVAYQRSS